MAKSFSIVAALKLMTEDFTKGINSATKQTYLLRKSFDGIKDSIKTFAALGVAALGVGGAMETFKKAMQSTDVTGDQYEKMMIQAESVTGVFFRTLANGDWSHFMKNIKDAIKAGKEYAEAMDYIENKTRGNDLTNATDRAKISELKIQVEKTDNIKEQLRLLKQIDDLEVGMLDRNTKLSQKNYDTQRKKLTNRGIDGGTLDSLVAYTAEGEAGDNIAQEYLKLQGDLRAAEVQSLTQSTPTMQEIYAKRIKTIQENIQKFVKENPTILPFTFALQNSNADELKAISDAGIKLQNDIIEANTRRLRPLKKTNALEEKDDAATAKQNKELENSTGLLNELNNQLEEYQKLQKQAFNPADIKKYGDAIKDVELRIAGLTKAGSGLLSPMGGKVESNTKQPGLVTAVHAGKSEELEGFDKEISTFAESANYALASVSTDTLIMGFDALAESIVGAGDGFENFGYKALSAVGGFLQQLGGQLIVTALLYGAFQNLMTNPATWPIALGVGIAAVAAGAAFKAIGAKGMKSVSSGAGSSGGGSGGSYGGSQGSAQNNTVVFELESKCKR